MSMQENVFVFEYKAPDAPWGECSVHYNTSFMDGAFRQRLGSNGYLPVSVLPVDIIKQPGWEKLVMRIWREKPSYEAVVAMTYKWIFENAPDWQINNKK